MDREYNREEVWKKRHEVERVWKRRESVPYVTYARKDRVKVEWLVCEGLPIWIGGDGWRRYWGNV